MITWWIHLSWSHAALILGFVVLALGIAWLIRASLAQRDPPARKSIPTVDYSREYDNKVQWLGPRYLLHTPINRRGSYVHRT